MSPKEFEETILRKYPKMRFYTIELAAAKPAHGSPGGPGGVKVYAYLDEHRSQFHNQLPICRTQNSQYVLCRGEVIKDRDNLFGRQNPSSSPFKVGDIITGDDRTAPRSIYHFDGYRDGQAVVRFVAYDGHLAKKDENNEMLWPISELEDRHVATYSEIIEAMHKAPRSEKKPKIVLFDIETVGLKDSAEPRALEPSGPSSAEEALTRIRDEWQKRINDSVKMTRPIIDHYGFIIDTEGRSKFSASRITEAMKHAVPKQDAMKIMDTIASIVQAEPSQGPKCDCGATKVGSDKHSNWCSTQELKP